MLLYLKDFPRTLKALQDTHWVPNSFFSALFLRAHVFYAFSPGLLNRPQCLPSPYRVTFDLFGHSA